MIQHEGVVILLDGRFAQVKSEENSACPSCSCKHICELTENKGVRTVRAVNAVKAEIGDKVIIEFKSSALVKGSLLVFLLPSIALLIGVLLGHNIGENMMGKNNGDPIALIFGIIFFALSSLMIFFISKKMDKGNKFYPKVKKII